MAFLYQNCSVFAQESTKNRHKWLFNTIAYKVDHNSDLERAKQKFETCGPAPIVVKLEQILYTV